MGELRDCCFLFQTTRKDIRPDCVAVAGAVRYLLAPTPPKRGSEEPRTRRTLFANSFAPEQHMPPEICPLFSKNYGSEQLRPPTVTNPINFSPMVTLP
ncbi:hypothetical protein RvY_15052 [Ramazzottius varieornatus]|uniref:Uncharacterized protein n=1 Tax=Ramazzottius varieornatus TaxID=947166 RepID=A0A1D1VTH5_RAMVA|nr:hypothetical protein RvY_15052 [Ramazzottius varieornatus]